MIDKCKGCKIQEVLASNGYCMDCIDAWVESERAKVKEVVYNSFTLYTPPPLDNVYEDYQMMPDYCWYKKQGRKLGA